MFSKPAILGVAALITGAVPVVLAQSQFQTSSDCTCPASGSVSTTTVFYDPNTTGSSFAGTGTFTTLVSSSGGGGGTGVSSSPASSAATGSPSMAVANINTLTAKSRALQAPASSLTLANGPLIAIGQGPLPAIIAGFADIVTTGTASLAQMQGMSQIPAGAASDAVFDAFRDFVVVHQQLLNILIGKAGLFTTVPLVGQPVAAALRAIEGVVDALAFGLINLVQGRTADFQSQASSLKGTLDLGIGSYSGAQTSNVARL